jgi:tRNA U34 5-carboxymethylaminomethyl modifying enzyme MnmG/GidA
MKHKLELTDGLSLIQAEITDITTQDGKITGVVTHLGAHYGAKAVIIASGTYLKGKIIIGDSMSSDIKGGANVGMKTCLFNMRNKQISGDLRPDYEIKTLSEVIPLLERL